MSTRQNALDRIKLLPAVTLGDIAMIVETAETQGSFNFNDGDDGSVWEDDVNQTLNYLANEIRNLAE